MIKDSRENEVVMSSEEFDVEIEGYAYCESKKNQCDDSCNIRTGFLNYPDT